MLEIIKTYFREAKENKELKKAVEPIWNEQIELIKEENARRQTVVAR